MNRTLSLLTLAALLASSSFAQNTAPAQPEPPKRDQKAVDYEKAVKDLKKFEGPFTIYQRKKELLLELPEDKLNQVFFVQSTLSTGFGPAFQAGDPISDLSGSQAVFAFWFERHDDDVWLVRPNFKYRWNPNDPLAEASSRSFPKAYLSDYKVEQTNPETHKVLINFNNFFNGEVTNLTAFVNVFGQGQFSLDRDKSGPDKVYHVGDQTVVRMNAHYSAPFNPGGGSNPLAALFGIPQPQFEDSRSCMLTVNYTLWFREKSDYMPRVADPRVGYFTQDFYNVDRFMGQKLDRTEMYINRWDVKKKDPTATLSDPIKPIVWTLDTSIPEKWRPAVREGILRWNKAFENIGIRNAVQVVDAPSGAYDHADGTRNVVRFTMSEEQGYAVALFRTDPFTGQILNAAVTIDGNYAAFVNREYARLAFPVGSTNSARKTYASSLFAHPAGEKPTAKELVLDTYKYRRTQATKLKGSGWTTTRCDLQAKGVEELRANYNIARMMNLNVTADEYVSMAMADVVAHEIGHCMGLRHNFVASDTLSTSELGNRELVKQFGVASSVMDYTPTNIQAILTGQKDIMFNDSVGPYDVFAIKYGYSETSANTPDGERHALSLIASNGGQKGHAFMTDEDADTFNPYVVRFDSATDPVNYAIKEIESYKRVRKWALANLPRQGESYADRNAMILRTLERQLTKAMSMSAFVGGLVGNRNFKGDTNEQPTLSPVAPTVQRQAMKAILTGALGVDTIDLPASELNRLGADYNSPEGSSFTAPIKQLLTVPQMMLMAELLGADKVEMISENAFKSAPGKDKYTLNEHYKAIVDHVFEELTTGKAVSSIRAELQGFLLDGLLSQAGSKMGQMDADARRIAQASVTSLRGKIASRLSSTKDADTALHYSDLIGRIKRWEDRSE